jgi:hypothetical protein
MHVINFLMSSCLLINRKVAPVHASYCILDLMHCTMSISSHVCVYAADHVEPQQEIKKERVQGAFGAPQVLSCEDANIVVIKVSPGASHHNP